MIEQLGLVSLLMEPTMILIVTDPPDDLPERIVERGYELAGRNGSPLEAIIAYTLGCYLWWLRGQLVRAEGDGETSVRIAREHQFATSIQMTVGYQLRVLADRGMLDEADELLDQTLPERVPVATNRAAHATLLSGAAHLHLARGRWEQALISARQVGELAAGRESCGPISAWRAWAAMALVGLGRTDEASQIATEQLEIAHRWASARAVGQALHALALTQAAQQRISTLQAAVDVLRSRPVPLELARALLELGASHRRRGERRAARLPLAEALEIAARCHSGLLTEVATTELHAAGARPRRPMRSGIDALTPTELRIATMAARGLSNPQIAQALFVTRKTVEAHLSHVYLKLSVRSRSQLQAALGRRERSDL
jgi:DNA-binding NarL/FixJ family response regulator